MEELGQRMSAAEFREWMVLDAHEPLPDRRADWHFSALSALTLNVHAKRQDGGAWKPDELRLFRTAWDDPAEAVSERRAAVAAQARQVFGALKARGRHVRQRQ